MMKISWMTVLSVVVWMCLYSCRGDAEYDLEEGEQLVYAEIESKPVKVGGTADLESVEMVWARGDTFRIGCEIQRKTVREKYRYSDFVLKDKGGRKAGCFVGGERTGHSGEFLINAPAMVMKSVYYPSSIWKDDSSNPAFLVWPDRQYYTSDTLTSLPMWSDVKFMGGPYRFRFLGGVLKITAQGSMNVSHVMITAMESMSGTFVNEKGTARIKEFPIQGSAIGNYIELICKEGVTLTEEGRDFFFSVPVGEYTWVNLWFYDQEGHSVRCPLPTGFSIKRGKITAPASVRVEME